MAISVTTLKQEKLDPTPDTAAATSSSFTPADNSLLLVIVRAQEETNGGLRGSDLTLTPSTGSATLRVTSGATDGEWSYGIKYFTIPITTGAAMTVQVDAGTHAVHEYVVEVYQITGHNSSSPIGGSATGNDADGDGSATITLDATPASDSWVFSSAEVSLVSAGVTSVTHGADQTEIYDSQTAEWGVSQTQRRTGSTSTSVSWVDLGVEGSIESGAVMVALEIKADAGGGGSGTINPATAALSLLGRAGSANAFSTVTIREVLINEAGSPVANRTGISLLVWYGGSPAGTPDLSYSALTTDANGTASWSIAPGSLVYNQPIFYVATDGGASLSQYTCARLVPTYA